MTHNAIKLASIPVAWAVCCGFEIPEQPQRWRVESWDARPGVVAFYSYRSAQPVAYLEQMTHPGPYPIPSALCMVSEFTFSVTWRYEHLPKHYAALEPFLSHDPFGLVIESQDFLVSDRRLSNVHIVKDMPTGFLVSADFLGDAALEVVRSLWQIGTTKITVLEDDRATDWFLDFRDAQGPIAEVLVFCKIDPSEVFDALR